MNRVGLRPGHSVLIILRGLMRVRHLQQFVVITLAVSFLLMLFRVIAFRTFLLLALFGVLSIGVLSWLGKKLRRCGIQPGMPDDFARLHDPDQVRYELRSFSLCDAVDEPGVCGVCLKPIREGAEAAYLPCMHSFHTECIQKWIRVQNSCPICKAPLE